MRLRQLQVLTDTLPKTNSLASSTPIPELYANSSGSSIGWTAERMNDFTIFCRVFITSDVSATGLQDRNNSGHIAETGYKISAYGSLVEVSKNAAELISTKCQCSVINTTRTQTLIQINPLQERVHNNFLNFSVSFRQQILFTLTDLLKKKTNP